MNQLEFYIQQLQAQIATQQAALSVMYANVFLLTLFVLIVSVVLVVSAYHQPNKLGSMAKAALAVIGFALSIYMISVLI